MLYFISAYCQEDKSFKKVSHNIFITGNTGLETGNNSIKILKFISEASEKENSPTSLIITGNFTPKDNDTTISRLFLQNNLLAPLQNFSGQIFLIPGVEEWRKADQQYLDDLEKYLQDQGNKIKMLPNDGCPLESEDINEDFVLITVDSQWFLEDWDDHPEMNLECEIKTREQFFVEFKDDLKDNHGKTKIVAIHHPIISNTKIGFINSIGGFTAQSYQNEQQRVFRSRLETLAKQFDDVIFISGNDRNLQFLKDDNLPQIISGAAASTQPAKTKEDLDFASDSKGFARLVIYEDGSSKIFFYTVDEGQQTLLHSQVISRERPSLDNVSYPNRDEYGPTSTASIYTEEETDKSNFYRWVWGEHYRNIYSRRVEVPNLFINDLPGNLKPIKEGGGQQSRSLRFVNDAKNEFTLRALRKSAIRYLQANAVKDHYVEEFLQNTVAQRYVQDFFTSQYPYAPFAISDLSAALDIYHTTPRLVFVPKQEGLEIHNEEYGDELYMFEEHVGAENREFENFGAPDDILSTTDLLISLKESETSYIDEKAYIKARLFDMLIGDWDRHEDQWRWAEFEQENGDKLYEPIPRDRDMAFPKYDGPIIALLKAGFPLLRKMQSYDEEIENIKWLNFSGYPLDQALIKRSTWKDWQEQVEFIQQHLRDEDIEKAFAGLPIEVQDENWENIKSNLKTRRNNLLMIARKYHQYLLKFDVITGTQLGDDFLITRKDNGITMIEISGKGDPYFQQSYNVAETKEIWIYGLAGEDKFRIEGKGKGLVNLRIIGGEGHDVYNLNNSKGAKIYDHKSKKSTFLNKNSNRWLVDSYEINNYDYEKRKYTENRILPTIGFDPDAGLSVGIKNIFTSYGLVRNPFTSRHELTAGYYFATQGTEIIYSGEFAHLFYNWNFGIDARFTGPNYNINYFGAGNETIYNPEEVSLDYNRVRMQQAYFAPSLIWKNPRGSRFQVKALMESIEVLRDDDNFLGEIFSEDNPVFDRQYYSGGEVVYSYLNKSNPPYPTRGMEFNLLGGIKSNIDEYNNQFGYLAPSLSLDYPLHHSGAAVLATKFGAEMIIGNEYEFYHAATLGGNHSLRGYRNDRFNGTSVFFQSTDIRIALSMLRTNFVPLLMGVTGGFDYGRVWSSEGESNSWHYNYGGSFWISGFNVLTGNFGYYYGKDGGRLALTLGFKF